MACFCHASLTLNDPQEYKNRLEGRSPEVIEVWKGSEPQVFKRLFHGWSEHLFKAKDLARPVPYLGTVLDALPPRHPEDIKALKAPDDGDDSDESDVDEV